MAVRRTSIPPGMWGGPPASNRAAAYIRMSTDRQGNSPERQAGEIRAFAEAYGLEVVKTYVDEARSGLTILGRTGIRQLLADALSGKCDFHLVLVDEVSRWGRFQDPDESAHYEFLLKSAGVHVRYCSEPFSDDGTPFSSVWKNLKRAVAAEWSRDLSKKVFSGQRRVALQGYWCGGASGLGYRRLILEQDGRRRIARKGQPQYGPNDRTLLVLGPQREVETIRLIFRLFVEERMLPTKIAKRLNEERRPRLGKAKWGGYAVVRVIECEKYVGTPVWNRVSAKLAGPPVANPPEEWVRSDSAPAIVSREQFAKAQAILAERRAPAKTDEQLLDALRNLRARSGPLSGDLIDADEATPPRYIYRNRFGSVSRALQLIGEPVRSRYAHLHNAPSLLPVRGDLLKRLWRGLTDAGVMVSRPKNGSILVSGRLVAVLVARGIETAEGTYWQVRSRVRLHRDYVVIIRVLPTSAEVLDYYLLQQPADKRHTFLLRDENGPLDAFRCTDVLKLTQRLSMLSPAMAGDASS